MRRKTPFGFTIGDLATAALPSGKKTGRHVGRVAVCTTRCLDITTAQRVVGAVNHKHRRRIQPADGYAYVLQNHHCTTGTKGDVSSLL